MAHGLFQLLSQTQATIIDVLAPAWSNAILAQLPEVRQIITMPVKHGEWKFAERYRLAKKLQAEQYDAAIILPNSWKSALIPWLAKIPIRRGWRGEFRYGLLNDLRRFPRGKKMRMLDRYLALGLPAHAPLPQEIKPILQLNPSMIATTLARWTLPITASHPILILCPGAEYGPAKQWPAVHHASLALEKLEEGWEVWLLGSAKDQAISEEIQRRTQQQCRNFAGQTTLTEAMALLTQATVVVSNDSGLMHIAAALNKPIIAIYGSTPETFAPPLNETHQILSLTLPCRPCYERTCPLKHLACLTEIKPEIVSRAIDRLLAKDKSYE